MGGAIIRTLWYIEWSPVCRIKTTFSWNAGSRRTFIVTYRHYRPIDKWAVLVNICWLSRSGFFLSIFKDTWIFSLTHCNCILSYIVDVHFCFFVIYKCLMFAFNVTVCWIEGDGSKASWVLAPLITNQQPPQHLTLSSIYI